ncbi:MAG TPA: RHS repeat-associated core domain-containing protein [Thermoanaerobaculia bacterium]|nr:RHS repeat-associated core domain-containing protein [Thermoanaerobaculia bacterium]
MRSFFACSFFSRSSSAPKLPTFLACALVTAGLLFGATPGSAQSAPSDWNVVLRPITTEFNDHAGLDYHQPSRKLILSANAPTGDPNSFELLASDGGHSGFSNVAGLQGEILLVTARDDGQGVSRGGFQPGTLFASTGTPGVIALISADGASVQNPWVVLPDETGPITGLHIDRTGVFGGDLLAVTATGGVWRVSSSATPTKLASLDTLLAGVAVVPNDPERYGPWAGKILVGAKEEGSLYTVDAQGQFESLRVGLDPQDIDIVPAHENLYGIDHTSGTLLGATEGALTSVIGDILITQESPGVVARMRWDGTRFVIAGLAEAAGLKQVAFSPAGVGEIPAVKQVYEKIAVVRHVPQLDSGRIEGALWQLTGEDVLLDGTDTITSDLLVPGTPEVTAAASATYGGTIEGSESPEPSDYTVTIQGNSSLRHVLTRTDPIELQNVPFPPAPQGTRDVQLSKAGVTIGDPATLRHLNITGNAGSVSVPPGTYGRFTVSGRNTLVLGIEGSTQPAVYNLESLELSGGSQLRLAGPVKLRVRKTVTLVGSTVGAADDPKRLLLEVARGLPAEAVTVGGNGVLYAIVRAPQGTISIEGNGRLRGTVACDILQVSGNGVLQITENDIPPPPVNRPPSADAGPEHTITLPVDTVDLEGTASDDGLPEGSTLAVTWTKVSGPGPVTFVDATIAATSATFTVDGEYVLKLTASDGQLSSSDTTTVTVIPRNQPPVVDAGSDQTLETVEMPVPTELHGTVTDDALPRGSAVTITWSVIDGPGAVTFADVQAAVTTASFDIPGVYALRLTANDTEFTVTDDLIVTVLKNEAPVVDAGPDETITLPTDTVTLAGTASDDGLPTGSTLAVTWTKVSGPGEVTFADAASAATSAIFTVDGEYVLELTATDGQLSGNDTITITVISRNFPPVVEAGPAQTIKLPAVAALSGTVTDDGLPRSSTVTATWSVIDGPGPVTFVDPNAPVTSAFFSAPGVYTLRLSANDTELTVSDDVVITVLKNDPPTVEAGPEQEVTLPGNVVLNGAATDDGLPSGSTLQVFWGQVSGPAPVILHDAFTATTPVTFTVPGTYVLRLTASDSQLSASDEVTVLVKPQPFTSRTYTLDADFSAGSFVNMTQGVPHQLQLDDATRTFNFIWVAVSSKGTVVKIDTETGAVLGEYFTSPAGQPKDPSRTTVDNNGNVWAGNRGGNGVVHIGLAENGQCVDRNNNGVIDTSTGYGDIRPWPNTNGANTNGGVTLAQDECILHYTKVTAHIVRHVSVTKENDVWVTGWGSFNQGFFDLIDGKTGLVKRSERSVGYGGYGGLVDKSGVLWSARRLLRWDTSKPLTGPSAVNGMAFTLSGGRATWDRAGKTSTQSPSETVWVEDRTPSGATLHGEGESWNWTSANPAPFSGALAHQSNINGGVHQHYFDGAGDMLSVGAGDTLFTYIYLDPANPPSQVMLQWNNADANWEHRAYWGQSRISWGVEGTESRRYMGPLPPAGQWVRLEVPASQVGLEGSGANWRGYDTHDSYGLCIDSQGNVWNTSLEWNQIHKFAPDGTHLGTFQHGAHWAQGCVVDKNDDVWVAHSRFDRTVGRLKNDGTYVGKIVVGDGPTGVAVDARGKIWATNYNGRTVVRIDPTRGSVGEVDFTSPDLGGNLYNYSDMTGSTLTGKPEAGTWSTVFNSGKAGAEWGRVGWTASVCGDGLLSVSVATSENGTTFGPSQAVTNGADPTVANGRYLRINVNFKRSSSGESPILYDLSVGTNGYVLPDALNSAPTVFAGAEQTITLPDALKLSGSICDDGFPRGATLAISWTQVSGPGTAIFTNSNSVTPGVTFTLPGHYVLRVTASDGEHTVSDEVSVKALPANAAPVANAGPDQTITLPNAGTLNGTVSDDGLPAGSTVTTFWIQVSGPGAVTFNDPSSPVTGAIFPVTGTYTLRLAGGDSHRTGTDDVVITVNPSPALNGATLALNAGNAGPYVTGTMQPLHATLRDSAGGPLANYGVEFTITGPNATTGSAVTNASGVATFIYSGTNLGTDTVSALVRYTATATINSPSVAIKWEQAAVPAVQGWIGGPLNGSTVTGIVPITVGAGQTLTNARVEYAPASNPSAVTVLTTGAQGGPGSTLSTFDTTLLANGNYVIRLSAVSSTGEELTSQVLVTVTGENKPGRITLVITDLTIPAAGLPITIARRYDSLDRNRIGDFGYGWSLEMAGPRLEVSPDYDVTITEPGTGRRITFQFAPTSFGFPFSFLYQPTYMAEPGVYGKLASNGCGTLVRSGGGVVCYLSSDPTYRPTVYSYTDPDGRVYTMTDSGKMQSIKDLNGNTLTFSSTGITSSAGNLSVPFVRDAHGRIARISDLAGNPYDYSYDATGDLVAVAVPELANPVQYEYAPGHLLNKEIDPRGGSTSATYYPDGRIESETDRMGHTTRYAYDVSTRTTTTTYPDGGVVVRTDNAFGNPVSIKDQLNRVTTITYDASQNILTRTDPLGKTWTFAYDANGNLVSTKDPLGNTERRTWDSRGRLLSITDAINQVKTFQYDAAGNLSALQDALGQLAGATYDAEGSQTSLTLPSGRSARFSYDSRGNRTGVIDHSGFARTQEYDSLGNLASMRDGRHGAMTWEHDALGNLTERRDSLGATLAYSYDANGNRTEELDANGNLYTHEYDAADRLIATTYPDGSRTTMTYDYAGRLLSTTEGDGTVERFVWDMAGQLVSATSAYGTPLAATTTYTYDLAGRLNSIIDARNNATVFTSDDAGRVKSIQDPAGRISSFTYDAEGRVTAVTRADNLKREARYDVRGRTTAFINPDGTSVRHVYDGMFLRASTNEEGKTTSYTYDVHSEIASVIDPTGNQTRYVRDEVGNVIGVMDANGRETRYEYDGEDRLIKKILPGGGFEQYTYDPVGHIVAVRLSDGNVNHLTWDGMDRLLRIDYFDGTVAAFTYSATGNRLTATTEAGVKKYEYDDLDRLSRITQPNGVVISYGYDAAANITSITTPRGVTSYAYDVLDRLKTMTDPDGGVTTYTYDLGSRLVQRLLPNGVMTEYSYDALDRVTSVVYRIGAADPVESFVYTFSPAGQRLSVQEANGARTNWTYDDASRLIREVVSDASGATVSEVSYTYDRVGNRTSMATNGITTFYQYNELDQLAVAGSTRYTYDGRGNLVLVTDGSSTTKYSYDAANRLAGVVMPNGVTKTYVYDADGLLIRETVGGSVRNYGWNEISQFGDIVYESDSSGASIAYSYGGDDLVQRLGTVPSYYIADGLGSIVGLMNSAGVQTDRYRYDAWGVRTLVQGSTVNPFGYRGQWTDSTTSLQYLRARHFSPGTGRFLTRDIADFDLNDPVDLNRYTYAGANPINAYDPTGYTVAAEYGVFSKHGSENASIIGYRAGRLAETLLTCSLNAILAQSVDIAWRQMAQQNIPNPFNKKGTPPWEGKANRITVAFGWMVKQPLDLVPDDRKNSTRKAAMFRAGPRELAWALSGSRAEKLFEFLGTLAHETFGIDGVFLGLTANGADKCENHAERKIVRHAKYPANTLLSVGASRPVCPTCHSALAASNVGCAAPLGGKRTCVP